MKLVSKKLNTDKEVLKALRETVKVTRVYAGVPVTSVSQIATTTKVVNRYGKLNTVGSTHKNTLKVNKATMIADNATAAYELILIGAVG